MKGWLLVMVLSSFTFLVEGCLNNSAPDPSSKKGQDSTTLSSNTSPSGTTPAKGDSDKSQTAQASKTSSSDPLSKTISVKESPKKTVKKPEPNPIDSIKIMLDPKSRRPLPVGAGTYISGAKEVYIRNAPAGYVTGTLKQGQTVSLTGATQYAGGRNWSQLSSGGWVASEFIGYR